jgi:nitrate/nitrite transport system permease protein
MKSLNLKAGLVSLLLFLAFLAVWHGHAAAPGTGAASTAGLTPSRSSTRR